MRLKISALMMLVALGSSAQTATNFTHTDIDANSHTLYDELNNGNVVVLKFFTNWCPVCHNSANAVINLYNTYQSNSDPVVFWALDRQDSEGQAGAVNFDAAHDFPFPVFGEAETIANSFGVLYQPEYKIIRPDYSYTETVYSNQIDQHVQAGLSAITGIQDRTLVGNMFSYDENGRTFLAWNGMSDKSELNIYDVSGKLVTSRKIEAEGTMTESGMASGVYTAVISSDEGSGRLKFAVVR
jgi:peroxiredoxin